MSVKFRIAGTVALMIAILVSVGLDGYRREQYKRFTTIFNHQHAKQQYRGAVETARRKLHYAEAIFPAKSIDYANALGDLAVAYGSRSCWDEAADVYRKSLPIYEARIEANDLAYAGVLDNLGVILSRQGELREANVVTERAGQIFENMLEDKTPRLLENRNHRAALAAYSGDCKTALRLSQVAAQLAETSFSETEPVYIESLHTLGDAHACQGELEKAELLYRRAITLVEHHFGKNNYRLVQYHYSLGGNLVKQKRYNDAVRALHEAYNLAWNLYGKDSPWLELIKTAVREIYQRRGEEVEADDLRSFLMNNQTTPKDGYTFCKDSENDGSFWYGLKHLPKEFSDYTQRMTAHHENVIEVVKDPLLQRAITHYREGLTHHLRGGLKEAISEYSEALRLAPTYEPAESNRWFARRLLKVREKAKIAGTSDIEKGAAMYHGRLISLKLNDTSLSNFLRIIAEAAEMNIVRIGSKEVRVTQGLIDVPWDQALNMILSGLRFTYAINGNVILVCDQGISRCETSVEKKTFRGQMITMDVRDTKLGEVLRMLESVSNTNIVLMEKAQANVTMRLVDVPWDQALDIVLSSSGFKYKREENVIRVMQDPEFRREMHLDGK